MGYAGPYLSGLRREAYEGRIRYSIRDIPWIQGK